MKYTNPLIALICTASFPSLGFAQQKLEVKDTDFSIPTSPAFAVLGVSPDNVVRPTTGKPFSFQFIPDAVNLQGKLKNGFAMEFNPYLLGSGRFKTLADYNKLSAPQRAFSRTNISLAISQNRADVGATDVALGIYSTLLNGEDVNDAEFAKKLLDIARRLAEEEITVDQAKEERKKLLLTKQLAPQVIVGAAPVWSSPDGTASRLRAQGYGYWISYGLPLSGPNQFIAHARYRSKELIENPNTAGQFVEQNSQLLGMRYRRVWTENAVSLEVTHVRNHSGSVIDDNYMRYSLAFEQKLPPATGYWGGFVLSTESGRKAGNRIQVGYAIKFGAGQERVIGQ